MKKTTLAQNSGKTEMRVDESASKRHRACTRWLMCRFHEQFPAPAVEQACHLAAFCKHFVHDPAPMVLKNTASTEETAVVHKRKTRHKKTRKAAASVDTSIEGIRLARQHLAQLHATGGLTDEQARALKVTKGIFYQSLTEAQKEQIVSIYHDAISEGTRGEE